MKKLSVNEVRRAWIDFFEKECGLPHKHYKSASLVPDNPTLLLNSAGMVPFIPYFIGTTQRPEPPRAVSIQKCARVGGKDSDLSNIGYTPRHHSFFEMLGNFSFGDYFKAEVIPMAWKFVTERLGLDPQKLYVSVFQGDETRPADKESEAIWTNIFREQNIYTKAEIPNRIWKLGAKDNFWGPPGPTGPCGPCSEIYYDLGEHILDKDDRYIEIWNLVFMEFEKLDDASLKPLENKNIDTGAGLERIAMVLQSVNNTFETDELAKLIEITKSEVFQSEAVREKVLIASAAEISLAATESLEIKDEFKPYFKIIVDHLRCVCFLIADGVRPSNVSRGYVLRMLIRRAGRFLHKLGYSSEPLLYKLSGAVVDIYGAFYDELILSKELIASVLRKEEELFAKTIENGLFVLKDSISRTSRNHEKDGAKFVLAGDTLFTIYSTYGLPLEIMEDEIAAWNKDSVGQNILIDYEGYEKAREEHSKASSTSAFNVSVTDAKDLLQLLQNYPKTEFLGYVQEETEAKLLAIFDSEKNLISEINFSEILAKANNSGDRLSGGEDTKKDKYEFFLLFDKTTFYAESGGQVSDLGYIIKNISSAKETNLSLALSHNLLFRVTEVKAMDARILHKILIELPADSISKDAGALIQTGDLLKLSIDVKKRSLTKLHHSSCHLLQAALRKILGSSVSQAGSQVCADYTRFDFNYDAAMTKEEIKKVEDQINSWVKASLPVTTIETTMDEATKMGALAFFEDKYEDTVRVLKMGDEQELASIELCGGTHVKNTSEISKIKIVSESSVASGVRRIKLLAAELVDRFLEEEKAKKLELEALEKKKEAEKEAEKAKQLECLNKLRGYMEALLADDSAYLKSSGNISCLILNLNEVFDFPIDSETLKNFATELKDKIESRANLAWVFLIGSFDEKVMILGLASKPLAENDAFKVNNIVKAAASLCGGGGGGRPDFAQAGAKDISKIPAVLEMVAEKIYAAMAGQPSVHLESKL